MLLLARYARSAAINSLALERDKDLKLASWLIYYFRNSVNTRKIMNLI